MKLHLRVLVLSLLICCFIASAAAVFFVKPTNFENASCPDEPCQTLEQYAQSSRVYFTTGSTFVFLAGNHSLQSTLVLTEVSRITLMRWGNDLSDANILCKGEATIYCRAVKQLRIQGLTFLHSLDNPNPNQESSCVILEDSRDIMITNSTFQKSGRLKESTYYKALISWGSHAFIEDCSFIGNTGYDGGAIFANNAVINLSRNLFFENEAAKDGGAVHATSGSLTIHQGNLFVQNSAVVKGGAIFCELNCILKITGNKISSNIFQNNRAQEGGAIGVSSSGIFLSGSVLLVNNRGHIGGGIYMRDSNAVLQGNIILQENYANIGGGICIKNLLNFLLPGVSYSYLLTGKYINNTATNCGGAVFVDKIPHITNFHNVEVHSNSGSALCFLTVNNVTFTGTTDISNNTGSKGGGIYSWKSHLTFEGPSSFHGNEATESSGGALYAIYDSTIVFKNNNTHQFSHNIAKLNGGAIYVLKSNIYTISSFKVEFSSLCPAICLNFSFNSAQNGGAMYLGSSVTFIADIHTHVHSTNNSATEYGGFIYYDDSATSDQCMFPANGTREEIELLPSCFIQLEGELLILIRQIYFNSEGDYAGIDGSFLYGGLLDRCTIEKRMNARLLLVPYEYILGIFHLFVQDNTTRSVTSEPYQLCFCTDEHTYDCSELKNIRIHRGQTFNLSILALDQMKNIIPTLITTQVSERATLRLNQNQQSSTEHCTNLTFNFYSTSDEELLILYPLNGPCRNTGLARAVVNVTVLPCPDTFTQLGEKCVCEERLQKYSVACSIEETPYITREAGSRFWMGLLNSTDGHYEGLILYETCPFDYCKQVGLNLTLQSLDKQCNVNRGKVLCGACVNNSSLMLGGFQCGVCSNRYLALLIPFAVAGIILVIFLSFLRLTVATGMLNCVILYANIVQVNRTIFFPDNPQNILTVFIAWLNLDLGFQTCFYDGMTAYAQTWLQFAFPLYVWLLISFIIISSRYSITVSKLIGHNPIAVLATLLLMSYTKGLKIIIEVYSSVDLDYPDNKTVRVWLKDANVPYLKSWHLLLTVVTTLILVFLFIPYTLLLLIGYKLYHYSTKKCLHWLIKVKPLLDSYYAPYEIHTRYWTGLLLLVRCGLYIVFSYNSLHGTSKSLVVIIITFVVLVIIAWLSVRVYSSFFLNVMEASIYLNLVVLSATTLAGVSSPPLVHTMVGVVFVTMMCIIAYHFHLTYTAKSAVWLKIKGKVIEKVKKTSDKSSSAPTVEVIDLREPLLDVN